MWEIGAFYIFIYRAVSLFDLRDKNDESAFYTQSLLNQMISHPLLVMMLSCSFLSCNHLSTVFPGYARLGDSACGVCWAGDCKRLLPPCVFTSAAVVGPAEVPGTALSACLRLGGQTSLWCTRFQENEHFWRMRLGVLTLPQPLITSCFLMAHQPRADA